MGSAFDALDKEISSAINAAFAEPAIYTPRRAGQYAPHVSDADRSPVAVSIVFSESPNLEWLSGARRGSDLQGGSRMVVGDAEAWMSKDQAASLGFTTSKGDRLEFRGRVFSVTAVYTTDAGDVSLLLVREGA